MTPDELNRTGLWLGLISGLLLIPEVFNLLPIDQLQNFLTKLLGKLEILSGFPVSLHPKSWQRFFSKEGRQKYIEPITAILGLLSTLTWVITIAIGVYTSSIFFILLGLFLPIYVSFERTIQNFNGNLSITRFIISFLLSMTLSLVIAPFTSLFRVIILILRLFILSMKKIFTRDKVLRTIFTIIAIVLFT
jgi:hypothetical protein